jgi:tetratricopeptide (TPR) repeat protein
VQAFKVGQLDEAIENFKRAKELDPSLTNAKLYLATAYASQYIPGAPSEENTHLGQQAIEEFKGVLDKDPNNLSAIDGVGAILYNMGGSPFDREKFNESKSYHKKHIEIRPDDPEPHYWIGVIDWSVAFRTEGDLSQEWSKKTSQSLERGESLPETVREENASKSGELIDEGIGELKKAIELRSDYDDAMAYLNLLYRLKADTEPTPEQHDQDVRMADDLVDQVKVIKGQKMQMQQQPPD